MLPPSSTHSMKEELNVIYRSTDTRNNDTISQLIPGEVESKDMIIRYPDCVHSSVSRLCPPIWHYSQSGEGAKCDWQVYRDYEQWYNISTKSRRDGVKGNDIQYPDYIYPSDATHSQSCSSISTGQHLATNPRAMNSKRVSSACADPAEMWQHDKRIYMKTNSRHVYIDEFFPRVKIQRKN